MSLEERVRVSEMAYPQIGRWGVMVGEQCLLRCSDTPEGKHEASWQVDIIRAAIRAAVAEEREACASLAYAETEACTRHHCCGEEIAAMIRARRAE